MKPQEYPVGALDAPFLEVINLYNSLLLLHQLCTSEAEMCSTALPFGCYSIPVQSFVTIS